MGTVWLAEHTMIGRRAALKLLHPMFTAQPQVVTRFFNEARAATAITDPGIVQIFDFGYHTDGSAYIAMELLAGEPLDRRLGRLGRLPVGEALRILRQVASTLGVTHARGIVHRDLKPENIFLVPDPEVPGGERSKVLDFGIAKLTGDPSVKTNTSAVMGTPAYMSPEQCRGAGHVDQRADVYALGCILFVLLTGHTPFEAEGSGELIAMHLREAPPAPSSRAPGIPPEIDALVLRCLAKNPAQRFASGAELAAELGRLLGAPSMAASTSAYGPGVTGSQHARPAAATTLSLGNRAASKVLRPSIRAWIAGAAVLVIGGVITAGVMASGRTAPASAQGAAPLSATQAPAPDPAVAAAPPAPASTPAPVAPAPDPAITLASQMKAALAAFVTWSRTHAGDPCPPISALGDIPADPWGTPLTLTCTDQPANQVAGVISAGPDATLGTPDDRGSWQLAQDVTELVHGPRWAAAVVAAPVPAAVRPAKKKSRPANDSEDIPSER